MQRELEKVRERGGNPLGGLHLSNKHMSETPKEENFVGSPMHRDGK